MIARYKTPRPAGDRDGVNNAHVSTTKSKQKNNEAGSRAQAATTAARETDQDKARFNWLRVGRQVPNITAAELKLAIVLACDRAGIEQTRDGKISRTRERFQQDCVLFVWFSQATLAAEIGITRQGLAAALRRMERRGLLKVTTGRGRGHATECELTISQTEKGNGVGCLLVEQGKGNHEQRKRQQGEREKATTRPKKRQPSSLPQSYHFNHLKKSSHQSQAESDLASQGENESDECAEHEVQDSKNQTGETAKEGACFDKQVTTLLNRQHHDGTGTMRLPGKGAGSHPEFEELFRIWPNRELDHDKALGAWINFVHKKHVDPKYVLQRAKAWIRQWNSEDKPFVPYLGKWLSERGWRSVPADDYLNDIPVVHTDETEDDGGNRNTVHAEIRRARFFDSTSSYDTGYVDETGEELAWLHRHDPEKVPAFLRQIEEEKAREEREGRERLTALREELHATERRRNPKRDTSD